MSFDMFPVLPRGTIHVTPPSIPQLLLLRFSILLGDTFGGLDSDVSSILGRYLQGNLQITRDESHEGLLLTIPIPKADIWNLPRRSLVGIHTTSFHGLSRGTAHMNPLAIPRQISTPATDSSSHVSSYHRSESDASTTPSGHLVASPRSQHSLLDGSNATDSSVSSVGAQCNSESETRSVGSIEYTGRQSQRQEDDPVNGQGQAIDTDRTPRYTMRQSALPSPQPMVQVTPVDDLAIPAKPDTLFGTVELPNPPNSLGFSPNATHVAPLSPLRLQTDYLKPVGSPLFAVNAIQGYNVVVPAGHPPVQSPHSNPVTVKCVFPWNGLNGMDLFAIENGLQVYDGPDSSGLGRRVIEYRDRSGHPVQPCLNTHGQLVAFFGISLPSDRFPVVKSRLAGHCGPEHGLQFFYAPPSACDPHPRAVALGDDNGYIFAFIDANGDVRYRSFLPVSSLRTCQSAYCHDTGRIDDNVLERIADNYWREKYSIHTPPGIPQPLPTNIVHQPPVTVPRTNAQRLAPNGREAQLEIVEQTLGTAMDKLVPREVQFVGGYKVVLRGWIGNGSFGDILRATHHGFSGEVAVKLLNKNRFAEHHKQRNALKLEFEALRRISQNAVKTHVEFLTPLLHSWQDNEFIYFAMPLYCCSLTERLGQKDRFPLTDTDIKLYSSYLVSALYALKKLHIIHHDIKPDNILVAPDGRLVLGDFGLCSIPSTNLERATGGTPGYSSPEKHFHSHSSEHNYATDMWSMGLVILELALNSEDDTSLHNSLSEIIGPDRDPQYGIWTFFIDRVEDIISTAERALPANLVMRAQFIRMVHGMLEPYFLRRTSIEELMLATEYLGNVQANIAAGQRMFYP
ncbi:kinase-like domain-containing protein [Cristinia sonorae]|uniref:Kinase-like domain-containing protein n=1 Tax=Cristinia sonorae TaxID=1940300 RepID=A0A8K0UQ82_9AGAR|nr:kinase-like domain-containing protein [Cristinia sonorae]